MSSPGMPRAVVRSGCETDNRQTGNRATVACGMSAVACRLWAVGCARQSVVVPWPESEKRAVLSTVSDTSRVLFST
jgi:hypothetical protein